MKRGTIVFQGKNGEKASISIGALADDTSLEALETFATAIKAHSNAGILSVRLSENNSEEKLVGGVASDSQYADVDDKLVLNYKLVDDGGIIQSSQGIRIPAPLASDVLADGQATPASMAAVGTALAELLDVSVKSYGGYLDTTKHDNVRTLPPAAI